MRIIISQNYPGTNVEHNFGTGGYPPLSLTAGNKALMERYVQVSRNLGYDPVEAVDPRNAGAADISFTSGHVDMAIDGLGLTGRR